MAVGTKFFAVLIVFIVAGCAEQKEARRQAQQEGGAAKAAKQQIGNFTLSSVSDDGLSGWQLEAEAADMTQEEVDLSNVRITSRLNGNSVVMAARKGLIKKDAQVGIFQDDVVLSSDDGTTLSTDKVNWFFKKQAAATERPVLVKTGALETRGQGASLAGGLSRISLNKDISMKTVSGAKIKCSGPLMMDYKKNVAVFNNNVLIENGSGKMQSRRMTVFFDPQKKALRRVEATGDVRLARDGSVSRSQRAVYFADEGRAVLSGRPTVSIGRRQAKEAINGAPS